MTLNYGVPIEIETGQSPRIAALDNQRVIMIYKRDNLGRVRVVNMITRDVGAETDFETSVNVDQKDIIKIEDNKALIIYGLDFHDAFSGQYVKIVETSGTSISGFGSRVQLTSDGDGSGTLTQIDIRKAVALYRGQQSGLDSLEARVILTSALVATPQAVRVLFTGISSPGYLSIQTLSSTGTMAATYRGLPAASGIGLNARILSAPGNLVSQTDEATLDNDVIGLTARQRNIEVVENIFAISYGKSGQEKTIAGVVASGNIEAGIPIDVGGSIMSTLPGDKFVVIENETNQLSTVNAVLTDDNVPLVLEQVQHSTAKIGDCIVIAFRDSGTLFLITLTQRAQFYQGSGPFGGAGRLLKTADLQIPGVRPNAIDVSSSGLAVLGANAGAPCQETDVIISAVAPYASWDNQSKNYPTGSAVTSVKFV